MGSVLVKVLLKDPDFAVELRAENNRLAVRSPSRRNIPALAHRKLAWCRDARPVRLEIGNVNTGVTRPLLECDLFTVGRSTQIVRAESGPVGQSPRRLTGLASAGVDS
jgi:hypothetical protein